MPVCFPLNFAKPHARSGNERWRVARHHFQRTSGPVKTRRTGGIHYPNHVPVKKEFVRGLQGTLVHASAESILSDAYLAPFESGDLQRMLDLMSTVEKPHAHSMCSRLMRMFVRTKFINFCGQAGARLNADQSPCAKLGSGPDPLSRFLRVLDPFLFGAPSGHMKRLWGLWVDRTINLVRWKSFISILSAEWNGFTIYVRPMPFDSKCLLRLYRSTVMLAVDDSPLAIPELNWGSPLQTAAIIATYLSIMTSVGSLITSVLLSGQNRGHESQSTEEAALYMYQVTRTTLGVEALAIMYSLPHVLLMWGMLCFVVALSIVIFASDNVVMRAMIAPNWALIAVLALWPVWWSKDFLYPFRTWLLQKKQGAPPIV
ncbi:hypothetical protein HYDPIDRAFT_30228 [Hydnomerulius pinastri MD-312]|uniref:Uncharacterized protein n=1 Tax=Hydnomerulius pinastri MD-312 TaxID=994086 RepID=A0A0C9WDM9_9AGAM|nr:hypothetical protein HYDPIDRAFT_30228 [Hydnomerulius pinastri MD-312]